MEQQAALEAPLRKKVIISYCWQPASNKAWVEKLAEDLSRQWGIDVEADFYSLGPGNIVSKFMERFASDETLDKVLVICNDEYTRRANGKTGGAGAEGHIISADMLKDLQRQDLERRYIPILRERHPEHGECIPTYLKGLIYVDFTVDEHYPSSLKELARTIYGKAGKAKPPLGPVPQFALGESEPNLVVANNRMMVDLVRQALSRGEDPFPYLNEFEDHAIEAILSAKPSYGEVWNGTDYNPGPIVAAIESLVPLRDDLVELLATLNRYSSPDVTARFLTHFFEAVFSRIVRQEDYFRFDGSRVISRMVYDAQRFTVKELFLYSVAYGLKHQCWDWLADLLGKRYYYFDSYEAGSRTFQVFTSPNASLGELYRERRFHEPTFAGVQLTHQRLATNPRLTLEDLGLADGLLFFVGQLRFPSQHAYNAWHPLLHFQGNRLQGFFDMLKFRPFLDSMLKLLGMKTAQELKDAYMKAEWYDQGLDARSLGDFRRYVNVEKLGTLE